MATAKLDISLLERCINESLQMADNALIQKVEPIAVCMIFMSTLLQKLHIIDPNMNMHQLHTMLMQMGKKDHIEVVNKLPPIN